MAKHVAGAIIFSILTVIFGVILFISLRIIFAIQAGTVEDLAQLIVWIALIPAIFIFVVIIAIGAGALTLLFLILAIVKIVKAVKAPKAETQYSSGSEPKLG